MPSTIKRPYSFMIAGGGTGGHIYPAIAIANALKAKHPDTQFHFAGAAGRMEMQKVPEAGYAITGLPISGFQRGSLLKNLALPFKLIRSLLMAYRLIKQYKPDVVIGVGGYASAPVLAVAGLMGKAVLIQEQNSYAGISNKILARFAAKICVAYHGMDRFFPADKIVFTGNPVRGDIYPSPEKRAEGFSFFGLDDTKPVLLVIGGSLGARTINKAIHNSLEQFAAAGIQVLWQTGKPYADTAAEAVKPFAHKGIITMPFISRMDLAYPLADAVVSRAGALSVSELCISGKAAILIPSPNVAEDHQTKNAMALVEKDAALILKDNEAAENLAFAAVNLIQDPYLRGSLSANILGLGKPDAAKEIAEQVLALIKP